MGSVTPARARAVLAVVVVVLLVPSVLAEASSSGGPATGQPALVGLVAVALTASGLVLPADGTARWVAPVLVGVAIAWLLPSLVPGTLPWHRGLLLLALSLPVRGARRCLVVLAVPVALGWGGQQGAAVAFALSALATLAWDRVGRGIRVAQAAGAAMMALVLGALAAWRALGDYAPSTGLLAYEAVLLTTCVVVGAGGRMVAGRSARMRERLLAEPPSDLNALAAILRDQLGDPTLRILAPGAAGLPVVDDGRTVAVLAGRDTTLADPSVALAATDAVRLVRRWVERREELERRKAALVAARHRVAHAVREQQRTMSAAMDVSVVSRLREAAAELDGVAPGLPEQARAALVEAGDQLAAAEASIAATAAGSTGPSAGALVAALRLLTGGSTVPCAFVEDLDDEVVLDDALTDDRARALYFAASESLANVHKHAGAGRSEMSLSQRAGWLCLTVRDDGVGGADATGTGLRGLRERLSMVGGDLAVTSSGAGGTEVEARVPLGHPVDAIRVHGRSTR